MPQHITPFVPGLSIKTASDAKAYIQGALEEVGPENLLIILRAVGTSKGMTALAREAGLTKAGLYRALSEDGDPKLSTLSAILTALGLQLSITEKETV